MPSTFCYIHTIVDINEILNLSINASRVQSFVALDGSRCPTCTTYPVDNLYLNVSDYTGEQPGAEDVD